MIGTCSWICSSLYTPHPLVVSSSNVTKDLFLCYL